MSQPSVEETAELEPIRGDWSWFALGLAAAISAAFLAGVLWASHRPPTTPPPHPQPAHRIMTPAPTMTAQRSAHDYLLVASLSSQPPEEPPIALPASANEIFIHYSIPTWPPDTRPVVDVEFAGKTVRKIPISVRPGASKVHARGIVVLGAPEGEKGFRPGIYLVHLRGPRGTEEVLSFVVVSGLEKILSQQPPPGGLVITDTALAPALTPDGAPKGRAKKLVGPDAVYFWFAYDAAVEGTVVEVHWFLDSQLVPEASARVRLKAGSGTAEAHIRCQSGTLPPGKWSVGVYLEGGVDALAGEEFVVVAPSAAGERAGGSPGTRPGHHGNATGVQGHPPSPPLGRSVNPNVPAQRPAGPRRAPK